MAKLKYINPLEVEDLFLRRDDPYTQTFVMLLGASYNHLLSPETTASVSDRITISPRPRSIDSWARRRMAVGVALKICNWDFPERVSNWIFFPPPKRLEP